MGASSACWRRPAPCCAEMSRRSPEPPTAMANARLSSRRFLRYKRRCCTPLRPQHDKVIGVRAAPPQPPLWGLKHNRAHRAKARIDTLLPFLRHRHQSTKALIETLSIVLPCTVEASKLHQRNATKPRVNTARGVPLVGKGKPSLGARKAKQPPGRALTQRGTTQRRPARW